MDRRTLFVMIAASWILVVFMMFSAPQPKTAAQKQDGESDVVAETEETEDQQKEDSDPANSEKQTSSQKEETSKKSTDQDSKNEVAQDPGKVDSDPDKKDQPSKEAKKSTGDPKSSEQSKSPVQTKDQEPNKQESETQESQTSRSLKAEFVSLGSLAADSPYRFLVTLDSRAASIHRLELVQRHRKAEKLKYKDLEVRYGYMGHLDLENLESGGCRVRTVGHGTPAHIAGVQVNDEIVKFNDEPVDSRINFEILLRQTKPGESVTITYRRAGNELTATVKLMRQPLEVIRPTIVPEIAAFAFETVEMKKSFAISLFEPTGNKWTAIGNAQEDAWEPEVSEESVKFYYPYKDEKECLESGFEYQAIKTFSLKKVAEEDKDDVTAMNYHLDFDVEIKNLAKNPRSFAYRVDGPNGLPTEDWWFAIKIHGEWAAVFTQAGARDVVASTAAKSFHFIGGPKIYTNGTKPNQRKPMYVIDPGNDNANAHQLKYIGVDSHYFVSAMIPSNGDSLEAREAYSAYAMPQFVKMSEEGEDQKVIQERKKESKWYRKLVPVNFKAYFIFEKPGGEEDSGMEKSAQQLLAPGESVKQSFMIFAGPKEPALLKKYEIDDTVTFGWFAAFSWPLVNLLHVFYAIIGNYAIAIVILTVLVRLAMMRFSRKMVLNSQMMQLLAPEIKAISEKYKDDFQAKSKAQQELFKKYNYNPFSGCLVMLIQLPVFIGLYRGLSVDMALRDQALIPGVGWCSNLAGPDQLWRWADDLPAFFSFLTHETGWLGPYFNLLPIISVVLMLIQQKLFTPPPADEQQAMMQKMMTFMMVFIGVIFFKVPAGLCIYFITSTSWAIMEKKLIPPPQLPEHLQKRLDELKELQAKEKEDGVEPGTYTNVTTTAGGNATRKHTERAKKRSQKNRRK